MFNLKRLTDLDLSLRDEIETTRHRIEAGADTVGNLTHRLAGEHRTLGIADFLIRHDVGGFRDRLTKAALLQKSLLERSRSGDAVYHRHVRKDSFPFLFDALAAGSFEVAVDLTGLLTTDSDSDWDNRFCDALRYFVLGDFPSFRTANETLLRTDLAQDDFGGYYLGLKAIDERDRVAFEAALLRIDAGHRHQSRVPYGRFKDIDEELLCIWGIGLLNLARHHGLEVEVRFKSELLPMALVVAVAESRSRASDGCREGGPTGRFAKER